MCSKWQKLSSKKSRRIEDRMEDYDHENFVNVVASKKFTPISANCSFIKEKGFHHPEDLCRKTIVKKRWKALYQTPRPAAIKVVHEFYANLASDVVKKKKKKG